MSSVLQLKKFEAKKLTSTELDTKSEYSKYQYVAYPRYQVDNKNDNPVHLEFPAVKITQRGITPARFLEKEDNPENCLKRYEVSLPLDEEQKGCQQLATTFKSIDKQLSSSKFKKHLLSPIEEWDVDEYTYSPIIRTPGRSRKKKGMDGEKITPQVRHPFFRVKFQTETVDDELQLKTVVFLRDPRNPDAPPQRQNIKTISELEKICTYGSTVRMIVMANKFWAAKNENVTGNILYGMTFKCMQLEVTPRVSTVQATPSFREYSFGPRTTTTQETTTQETTQQEESEEVSDVEVSDVEDSEEEVQEADAEEEVEEELEEEVEEEVEEEEEEVQEADEESEEEVVEEVKPKRRTRAKKTSKPTKRRTKTSRR